MIKKIVIAVGAVVLAVALGVGIYQSSASKAEPTLSLEEVKRIVSSQYPGTITEVELEKKQNGTVYEVEIDHGDIEYEMKVDGTTGDILELSETNRAMKEAVDGKETQAAKDSDLKTTIESSEKSGKNAVISESEAMEIAQKEFAGTVTDIELDEEDGRLIYEIEIEANGKEAEFDIDAMTGEVIVIEIEED